MFFGFAIADSMFSGCHEITREQITAETARNLAPSCQSCCNASHSATLAAAEARFGIVIAAQGAPQVSLSPGDSIVVMSVRGLPRLDASRHEYSEAEIASATFAFSRWTVQS
jgi:hypothetical protein